MRLLIEIAVAAGLLAWGWNQPFKDHFAAASPTAQTAQVVQAETPAAAVPAAAPAPAATPNSTAWINEPTIMDRPASTPSGHHR